MKNKIIGIDVGNKGAIVIRHHEEIETIVMPMLDGKIDAHAIAELFLEIASEIKVVYIEEVFVGKGCGAFAMLNFGMGIGQIRGILTAYKIPYVAVRPQKWQKTFFEGVTGSTTKAKALKVVKRLFPQVQLMATARSKVPHDGIVDALLISEYARLSC